MFVMGKAIHEFKIPTNYIHIFSYITYNVKTMNSSVHKNVHHCQTTKFYAHEIKGFHSITVIAHLALLPQHSICTVFFPGFIMFMNLLVEHCSFFLLNE